MEEAILGASGFVGSNYLKLNPKTKVVRRNELNSNHRRISCQNLIIAAPSANKWSANLNPQKDRLEIESLLQSIKEKFLAERVLLFSTIDVYGNPNNVSESETEFPLNAYGENRLLFAQRLSETFQTTTIRLSGLYGPGLKKNLLHDILRKRTEFICNINPNSTFQWTHVLDALKLSRKFFDDNIEKVNIVAEPVKVSELEINTWPWQDLLSESQILSEYNVTTNYDATGYFYDKSSVLNSIYDWITSES